MWIAYIPNVIIFLVILSSTRLLLGSLSIGKMVLWNGFSKKLKCYIQKKVSDLIINGRIRLHQLSGIYLAEIVVPFTNVEIISLWVIIEDWQRARSNYLGKINGRYSKRAFSF